MALMLVPTRLTLATCKFSSHSVVSRMISNGFTQSSAQCFFLDTAGCYQLTLFSAK
jgi:hypothetical protein